MGPLPGLTLEHVTPLTPSASIQEVRRSLLETGLSIAPLVSDEKSLKLYGVVSRRALLGVSSRRATLRAGDLAEEPPVTLTPSMNPFDAASALVKTGVREAPATESNGRYLGVYTLLEFLAQALREGLRRLETPVSQAAEPLDRLFNPDDPVYEAWQYILSTGLEAPVVEDGRLVGVVTEYDLLLHGYARPLLESGKPSRGPKIASVMRTPVYSVETSAPLHTAVRLMVEKRIGRVYVIEHGNRPVGVVRIITAAKVLLG